MIPERLSAGVEETSEIPALIEVLYRTGKRLEELTGGKVDSVVEASGNVLLLPEAQSHLRFQTATMQEKLRFNASYDLLTSLANRSLFITRVEQHLVSAAVGGHRLAVFLIDLERFKSINDSFGQAAGDALLIQMAEWLTRIVGDAGLLARIGSDHFALVLPEVNPQHDPAGLLEKTIQACLAHTLLLNEAEVQISAKVGIALFPDDGAGADVLLNHAEAALNKAKANGEQYLFYTRQMTEGATIRLALENQLRQALDNEEFMLHYQPKVELTRGQIVGAEALIRWRHPSMGMVSPSDFIPLAEETGLIIQIGEWVLKTACEQLKSWQNKGLTDITLSVNLSGRQFQQENIVDLVAQVLCENDLQAQYLEIEITESAIMRYPEQTIDILRRLKGIGVCISLDDFGTGYSSLNYLKHFPIDTLKIDQSFVRNITSCSEDAAIACAVISLAHSLNHYVLAEGVETEAQLRFLRRHHCDQIQGFYFSRPLPVDEFELLLRSEKTLEISKVSEGEQERTLLIVDDDENILSALHRLLRRDGYHILTAGNAAKAFELLALNDVQVIISDQRMPQMTGIEFLSQVKGMYPDTMRLVLSSYTELKSITDAINRGAIFKFLVKPCEDDLLREHIREAFLYHESKRGRLQVNIPRS